MESYQLWSDYEDLEIKMYIQLEIRKHQSSMHIHLKKKKKRLYRKISAQEYLLLCANLEAQTSFTGLHICNWLSERYS